MTEPQDVKAPKKTRVPAKITIEVDIPKGTNPAVDFPGDDPLAVAVMGWSSSRVEIQKATEGRVVLSITGLATNMSVCTTKLALFLPEFTMLNIEGEDSDPPAEPVDAQNLVQRESDSQS